MPVRVIDVLKPHSPGAFKVVQAEDLGGAFIKAVQRAVSGRITLELQLANGNSQNFTFYSGASVSATAPTSNLYNGYQWWDTANDTLHIHNGNRFVDIVGMALSNDDRHALNQIDGLIEKTQDLNVEVDWRYQTTTDAAIATTAIRPTGAAAPGYTFAQQIVYNANILDQAWVVLRVPRAESKDDFAIRLTSANGRRAHTWHGGAFRPLASDRDHHYAYAFIVPFAGTLQVLKADASESTRYTGRVDADHVDVDASAFGGNLDAGADTVQKVAERFDALTIEPAGLRDTLRIADDGSAAPSTAAFPQEGNIYNAGPNDISLRAVTVYLEPDATESYGVVVAQLTRNAADNYHIDSVLALTGAVSFSPPIDLPSAITLAVDVDIAADTYFAVILHRADANAVQYSEVHAFHVETDPDIKQLFAAQPPVDVEVAGASVVGDYVTINRSNRAFDSGVAIPAAEEFLVRIDLGDGDPEQAGAVRVNAAEFRADVTPAAPDAVLDAANYRTLLVAHNRNLYSLLLGYSDSGASAGNFTLGQNRHDAGDPHEAMRLTVTPIHKGAVRIPLPGPAFVARWRNTLPSPRPAQNGYSAAAGAYQQALVYEFGGTSGAILAPGGTGSAANVSVDSGSFNGNLSGSDDNVQAALETLDRLDAGEENVRADWLEDDSGSDAFIRNKGRILNTPLPASRAGRHDIPNTTLDAIASPLGIAGLAADADDLFIAAATDDIYAFDIGLKARNAARSLDSALIGTAAANILISGISTDGETLYVADSVNDHVYAFDIANRARNPGADVTNTALLLIDNTFNCAAVAVDGNLIFVADSANDAIYAFNRTTNGRETGKDLDQALVRSAAADINIAGMATDGDTLWVVDDNNTAVHAFDVKGNPRRAPEKDLSTALLQRADLFIAPRAIATGRNVIWVGDFDNNAVYAFDKPETLHDAVDLVVADGSVEFDGRVEALKLGEGLKVEKVEDGVAEIAASPPPPPTGIYTAKIVESSGLGLNNVFFNILDVDTAAGPILDEGGLVTAGTGSTRDQLTVRKAGLYALNFALRIVATAAGTSQRSMVKVRFDIKRADPANPGALVIVPGTDPFFSVYARYANQTNRSDAQGTLYARLEVDDVIELLIREQVNTDLIYNVGGGSSVIQVVRLAR